jgi:hypothetical protein
VLQETLGVVQKIAGDGEVLGVVIVGLPDRVAIQAVQYRAGIAQDDGRVRGDEELRVPRCREFVDDPEKRELPVR